MKYLVMECKEGYAVLMGEDAAFIKAADLHYKVGQTVTDPVLMGCENKPSIIYRRTLLKIAAAAACIALTVFSGYSFYSRNMTDTIVISSQAADIEIHLNKNGSVVALTSESPEGKEIIRQYKKENSVRRDSVDVANELLAIQIKSGYISSGDTIDVSVDTENSENGDSYRNEIENEIMKLDLKVSGAISQESLRAPEKENTPAEEAADDKKKDIVPAEPPKSADKEKPSAAEIPEPKQDIKTEEPAPVEIPEAPEKTEPPEAPEVKDRPEPPATPDAPAKPEPKAVSPEASDKPEPPAAHEAPDKPEPPAGPIKPVTPERPVPTLP